MVSGKCLAGRIVRSFSLSHLAAASLRKNHNMLRYIIIYKEGGLAMGSADQRASLSVTPLAALLDLPTLSID